MPDQPQEDKPDLLGQLHKDAIRKLPPTFAELRQRRLFRLNRRDGGRTVCVSATTKLCNSNVADIFTARSRTGKPNEFWAKGLIVANFMVQWYETLFWQTGQGVVGLNFHHRDALRSAYRVLVGEKRRLTEYFRTFGVLEPEEWPIPEAALLNEHLIKVRDQSDAEELLDADAAANRGMPSFQDYHLALSLGFQFTAAKKKGEWSIIRFDVDSSLNSAAITRDVRVKPTVMAQMLPHAVSAIHKNIRGFDRIGLAFSFPECDELNTLARENLKAVSPGRTIRLVPIDSY